MMRGFRRLVGATLVLGLVVPAASADARVPATRVVVVDRSMAGVKLGMSPAAVKRRLGKADSRSKCGSSAMAKALCGGSGVTMWRYTKPQLSVTFIKHRVVRLSTTSPKLRTRSGIGVGVGFDKVRARYPHGTVGGRPDFHWYYLRAAPRKTGDVYTLASDASGEMTGKIVGFDIGRFDSRHHCAFFSDVPQCA
jgi:hypothetical protein